MRLIYWCSRHKKEIPLEEQEACISNCEFNCCCPDTIVLDNSDVDSDSLYWCKVHDVGIDEYSGAYDYCRACSQLVENLEASA